MVILIGLGFLAWLSVFGFLWSWALDSIDGWWGALLPIGWLILSPCIVIQLCIWFGGK